MNTRSRSILTAVVAVAFVVIAASVTLAAAEPAGRKIVFNSKLSVRADPNLQTAEIRLTRDAAHSIALAGTTGAASVQPTSEWMPTPRMTAVAGIALSLALVTGGLWTLRRRVRLDSRVAIPLFVGFVVLATTTLTVANMLPPSKYRGNLRKALATADDQLDGPVVIVIDDTILQSELVLPTNDDANKPKS